MLGNTAGIERVTDLAADPDEVGVVGSGDGQADPRRGQNGIHGAAEGDIDGDVTPRGRHRHLGRVDPARHVDEGDIGDPSPIETDPGPHPTRRDVDDDVTGSAVLGRDSTGVDRPQPEGDRPVAARGRKAVLVPEEHPEVAVIVVGRSDEPAVHVGMAAWFVAEQGTGISLTASWAPFFM